MAQYRLSAQVLGRSSGRSATAAAAYRAADKILDERTETLHDYTRKGGVLHTEILAPDNAPAWMSDRAALWNAVEKAERRKDAQLTREVQLSLPHELSHEERVELTRTFIRDTFVSAGMIADICHHAPDRQGDQRNYHAHVLLTLRELTGDGFGKKQREWNKTDHLQHWRQQWDVYQNRALEHAGHDVRVDHRSYADQGLDQEPQRHEGPDASNMRRKDKDSRIAAENDEIKARNAARRSEHLKALHRIARLEEEREKFRDWAAETRGSLHSAQTLSRLDLALEQGREMPALEDRLEKQYEPELLKFQAEARKYEARLNGTGIGAKIRRFIVGKRDFEKLEEIEAEIANIEQQMGQAVRRLERAQAEQRRALEEKQAERTRQQEEGITRAQEARESSLAARLDRAREEAEKTAQNSGPSLSEEMDKVRQWREERRAAREKSNDNEKESPDRSKKNDRGLEM